MITKYKYSLDATGIVTRTPEYSFTPIEELGSRLNGIDDVRVISNIVNTTLKGEAERSIIEAEDEWFKVQSEIQAMDVERATLEFKLKNGDVNGNPLTPDVQAAISARIAECKEGTITVEKEFYDHYTRKTHKVKEVHQTPYTIALELRADLEGSASFLDGIRGVSTAPARPKGVLSPEKEIKIRKELVRREINVQVGDSQDLIADMSKALTALIKQVNGQDVTAEDTTSIQKYVERQSVIAEIISTDYNK